VAVVLVILDPRLLPKGKPFWSERERFSNQLAGIFMTWMAVMPALFQIVDVSTKVCHWPNNPSPSLNETLIRFFPSWA